MRRKTSFPVGLVSVVMGEAETTAAAGAITAVVKNFIIAILEVLCDGRLL